MMHQRTLGVPGMWPPIVRALSTASGEKSGTGDLRASTDMVPLFAKANEQVDWAARPSPEMTGPRRASVTLVPAACATAALSIRAQALAAFQSLVSADPEAAFVPLLG